MKSYVLRTVPDSDCFNNSLNSLGVDFHTEMDPDGSHVHYIAFYIFAPKQNARSLLTPFSDRVLILFDMVPLIGNW